MTVVAEGVMNQMHFSHDTELTLRDACALVNSDRAPGRPLTDQEALDAFLDVQGWTGRRDRDDAELAAVHALRDRLVDIWAAAGRGAGAEEDAVAAVNALLSDTRAAPWLTRHPEMPEWHLHMTSPDDPLAQRMGAEMAMALADLVRAKVQERLGADTRLASEVNGIAGNWISFSIEGDAYWVFVERDPLTRDLGTQWIRWAVIATVLSLLAAIAIENAGP